MFNRCLNHLSDGARAPSCDLDSRMLTSWGKSYLIMYIKSSPGSNAFAYQLSVTSISRRPRMTCFVVKPGMLRISKPNLMILTCYLEPTWLKSACASLSENLWGLLYRIVLKSVIIPGK